jgi:hypothetical protein
MGTLVLVPGARGYSDLGVIAARPHAPWSVRLREIADGRHAESARAKAALR